ncbi:uncharacterized protein [Pempheris klunzingeri]|uniref:uncharacterized protein n=1 Tax=Pempheris klunzingeri TaxID=3127111 RepID=UPI0039815A61
MVSSFMQQPEAVTGHRLAKDHGTTAGALLLQAPPSVSVTVGSEVVLSCDITAMGGRCSQVAWLHVGQVSGLTVSSRFVSGAQGGTRCLLQISSAALQDAGRYYCVYINGVMLLAGDGTSLTVTESVSHSPVVDLLVPSEGLLDSSLPVPLVCLVSGLEDPGRVTVDWEVDWPGNPQKLSPRILPDSEVGVIGVQVYIPGETWMRGAQVSCQLTDGDLKVRKTVSTGPSAECVFLTSIVGAVCVVLFVATVVLSILLLWQQRGLGRKSSDRPEVSEEAPADLHYAALRFEASGRRTIGRLAVLSGRR